ncbi:MAG: hypothetical protein GF313_10745 [Caldithrix sp.]|nr:hypothetical protein [Caldithrix sp.]
MHPKSAIQMDKTKYRSNNRWNMVLPREHGSWGFVLEPLFIALIIGFTWDGFLLGISAVLAFLAHQPMLNALNAGQKYKSFALTLAATLSILALAGLSVFMAQSNIVTVIPLIVALSVMVVYFFLEILGFDRKLYTRMIGASAMGLVAMSILLAAGWQLPLALGVLAVILSRAISTTIYIRARLQLQKGNNAYVKPSHWTHALILPVMVILAVNQLIPWLAALAVTILCIRAYGGLSRFRQKLTVKRIGMYEFVYGMQLVILTVAGYIAGL